jgi:hypothetical protein
MSDNFDALEQELRALRPAAPSDELVRSIDRVMGESAAGAGEQVTPRRRVRAAGWGAWAWGNWAVAGALALVVVTVSRDGPAVPDHAAGAGVESGPDYRPVEAARYVVEVVDEGVVTLEDGTPVRRVRESFVDSLTWRDEATKATLVVNLPGEDVSFERLTVH